MTTEPAPYLDCDLPGACWLRSQRRFRATVPRRHHELVALHVISGSMRYLIDDAIVTVGPQAILWAFSGQSHMLLDETDDFDMWVFVFARRTLIAPGACPPPMIQGPRQLATAFNLPTNTHNDLVSIAASIGSQTDLSWRETGLKWWAMRAWAACGQPNAMVGRRTHPSVEQAAHHLQDNPDLSLEQIASMVNLSLPHLARLFRKEVGQTLGTYRTRSRLNKVDHLLANGSESDLLNAAFAAGFGSYSQFFRSFVAERGVSPRSHYAEG